MSTTSSQQVAPTETDDFEKRVELLEKDDDEKIARGAVLVPDRLDHQGDFLRSDTIAGLRDNWSERVEEGDAHPGVMHAVFPGDQMELVEDRHLDAAETIGSKTLPAGTWVQGWKYRDDQLWQLVDDDVLGGFSIGGTAKGVIYEPGAMPDDVEIPDEVQAELDEAGLDRDDIMVREITDGRILETSTVDHPAVPDAVHAERKTLAKAAPALTENIVAARLYLEARGHDPDDARRLAEFLQEHKQASEGGLLGRAKSWLSRGAGIGDNGRAKTAADGGAGVPSDVDSDDTSDNSGNSDNSDTDTKLSMSDDDLAETLDGITERLDTIEAQLQDDGADDDGVSDEKTDNGGDSPSTEEKVDELADATKTVAEQVDRVAEQVEQMANAQGVSQQADTGETANSKEKTWNNSPFSPRGDD